MQPERDRPAKHRENRSRTTNATPKRGQRTNTGKSTRDGNPKHGHHTNKGRTPDRNNKPNTAQEPDNQDPIVPDTVQFSDLGKELRGPLRTLSKENAEFVGRHLAMVVNLIDTNPELAYEHAKVAVRRAGRVDVVREAAGICAYRTERYNEALRELRTVRRLNGSTEHLPLIADCERGLGRPERAIALAATPEAEGLDPATRAELAIVVSGARMDMGDSEAAIATLDDIKQDGLDRLQLLRVKQAKARLLEALGRADDAKQLLAGINAQDLAAATGGTEPDEEVIVYDLIEESEQPTEPDPNSPTPDRPNKRSERENK